MNGTTFAKSDLSGVKIENCNIQGMTIDGIPVADLIATRKRKRK